MATKTARTTMLKDGTVLIPEEVRREFGLAEGAPLTIEASDEGILLRPIGEEELEIYTSERKAEFLLNNAMDPEDYAWATEETRRMGLDPTAIPHIKLFS